MEETEKTELPCKDKLVFNTKESAEGSAVYAQYLHGTDLKVYKCKNCKLWHLASK